MRVTLTRDDEISLSYDNIEDVDIEVNGVTYRITDILTVGMGEGIEVWTVKNARREVKITADDVLVRTGR